MRGESAPVRALPDRLRVGGSGPRPGHLHVAAVQGGGHSGRPHTIILGLDDARLPLAGHQDPLLLDHERGRLEAGLATSQKRLREQLDDFAKLLCRLRSLGSDFNSDYHVSFAREELDKGDVYYNYRMGNFPMEEAPGISVFHKDETGAVFHTYSSYARGLDSLIGTYHYLDLVPKGRHEADLPFTMAWVRRHDQYDD